MRKRRGLPSPVSLVSDPREGRIRQSGTSEILAVRLGKRGHRRRRTGRRKKDDGGDPANYRNRREKHRLGRDAEMGESDDVPDYRRQVRGYTKEVPVQDQC